jgi:hypothetical protein
MQAARRALPPVGEQPALSRSLSLCWSLSPGTGNRDLPHLSQAMLRKEPSGPHCHNTAARHLERTMPISNLPPLNFWQLSRQHHLVLLQSLWVTRSPETTTKTLTSICFILLFFFFLVLGLELRAYTLTHSTSIFFFLWCVFYLPGLTSNRDLPDLRFLSSLDYRHKPPAPASFYI